MAIRYGARRDQLGLADSHGGNAAAWGPEYGAPAADGSWWIVDANKHRLAHYSTTGSYLGAVPIPGRYVGVQCLNVFGDGWMWAADGQAGAALVSDGHAAHRVSIPVSCATYSDGRRSYAGDPRGTVTTVRIVDGAPVLATTTAYRTPTGARFRAYLASGSGSPIVVELPDAQPPTVLRLRYSGAAAQHTRPTIYFETAAANNGQLFLYIAGNAGRRTVAALVTISPNGQVGAPVPTSSPFSDHAPGSPALLHVAPGSDTPSLIFVDSHAVHVYSRTQ